MKQKEYAIFDKAWQPLIGCSPNQRCSPACWARKTVARVAECQRPTNPGRAAFFASVLTPDLKAWNGAVRIDEAHLTDPLKWNKPALIAAGFHGDVARLATDDLQRVFGVAALCPQHRFCFLTKQPELLWKWAKAQAGGRLSNTGNHLITLMRGLNWHGALKEALETWGGWPLRNVSIGVSLMDQSDADNYRIVMRALHEMGWRTHVWREPQIGPIDMVGWEFIELQVIGGHNGKRRFDLQWARDGIAWGRKACVKTFVKQLGALWAKRANLQPDQWEQVSRHGSDPSEWPEDLRVRELPAAWRV